MMLGWVPKAPRSTVLSAGEEAIIVALRKHTLLPLDDCLYALQATIPHLTRSSLHRCLKRHGISRLPEIAGDKIIRKPFKRYPIGYFHLDIAEVRTEEGKLYLGTINSEAGHTAGRSPGRGNSTDRSAAGRGASSCHRSVTHARAF